MRALPTSVLLLAACASPPEPPPAQPDVLTAAPRDPPPLALQPTSCELPGGQRYGASDTGIGVFHIMPAASRVTDAPARHLRLAGDQLYFFDTMRPILKSVQIGPIPEYEPTTPRTVLELPPLEHPGFASPDPLAYLQRQEDLSIADGVLCLDVHDRPEAPTLTYNLRADLATGAVERRLVEDLTGDRCGSEREAIGPRLCTPDGPSAAQSADGTCVRLESIAALPLAPTVAPTGTP